MSRAAGWLGKCNGSGGGGKEDNVNQSALNFVLLAGKVARDTDPLQSAYTQGTLLNRSCGVFILFFFVLISRKQRVGKQRSLRTAGSLSKEWMAEHKVLTHPLMEDIKQCSLP